MNNEAVKTDTRLWVGIHPSAIIHEDARLGPDVDVGPGAIIGPGVVIGARTRVGAYALIERDTVIGEDCAIHHGAVLGTDPQDLKYQGEPTELVVGDRTVIREYATLNRGTLESGRTTLGSDCMVMAYAHLAHDCHVGDHVILANSVAMGGHVTIEDWVIVGGLTAIHQFVRIGAHAFVGGASRVPMDIAPFVRAAGSPLRLAGINSVGLERRGFGSEVRKELKRAYRVMFGSSGTVKDSLERARAELDLYPDVERFLNFFEESERGVSR